MSALVIACGENAKSGSSSSSGGAATATGGSISGGATNTGGATSTGGRGSGGELSNLAGSGGNLAAAGTGGASGSNNTGGVAGGGSGTGGSANTGCTRELLKSTVDAYFTALAAHDPAGLPLSDPVKFTENGKLVALGGAGLWKSAGALKYSHSALDTETCSSATQAVVPDAGMDIPLALRLKLQNQKIIEIESIAVRPGDYQVASNTAALITSRGVVKWEDTVPTDQRNSRAEIAGWMDKYYRLFPRGVCNVTSSCKRLENGGGSFDCSAGAACDPGQPGPGQAALNPRLILVDVETGLGVGFTMFMGNTDMHLFKMYGGQVYGVSAVLGAASGSGWD